MSYYISTTGELKFIEDSIYAEWVAKNNPKAEAYTKIDDPPSPNAQWDGTKWIAPPVYVPPPVTAEPEDIEAVVAQFNTLLARMRELGLIAT